MSAANTEDAPGRGCPRARDRRGRDLEFLVDLGRAFAGAVIFAMPMLMTMELWSMGVYVSPSRLLALVVLLMPLLVGLSSVIGFKPTETLRDDVVDAFVAVAVAAAMSATVLLLFGVVTFDTPAGEAIGRITLQVIPASIGAMLARSQVSGEGDGHAEERPSYGRELTFLAVGALFLGLSLAPTDEVMLLAYMMGSGQEIALALLSLTLMHAFVYTLGFRAGAVPRPGAAFWSVFVRFTVVGYAIVLLIAFFLLWTFGRTDDTDARVVASCAIVLGFPCAIGAAAARLIL